jgi:hypothetical protein
MQRLDAVPGLGMRADARESHLKYRFCIEIRCNYLLMNLLGDGQEDIFLVYCQSEGKEKIMEKIVRL